MKLTLRLFMIRALDRVRWAAANAVPHLVVPLVVARCGAHATTGKYAHVDTTELRLLDAMQRWDA